MATDRSDGSDSPAPQNGNPDSTGESASTEGRASAGTRDATAEPSTRSYPVENPHHGAEQGKTSAGTREATAEPSARSYATENPYGGAERGEAAHRVHEAPLTTAELSGLIDAQVGGENPELASVLKKLVGDQEHRLNLTNALRGEPGARERVLNLLQEMGAGRALQGSDLASFLRRHPGSGPLFDAVPADANLDAAGRSRKQVFVDKAKATDPARRVGPTPDETQLSLVRDYGRALNETVRPAVEDEVAGLVEGLRERFGGDVDSSVRVKQGDAIIDKVGRMTHGSLVSPPRPGYEAGDVIDAVGARITVESTEQLGALLEEVKAALGTGDDGRILEIENMYANPKSKAPSYRVIPMVVRIEVESRDYTYELQLTTRRASMAADLNHNTIYKPYIELTEAESQAVNRAVDEAAALEQLETRGEAP